MTRIIVAVFSFVSFIVPAWGDEVLQFLGQSIPVAMSDVLTGDQIEQIGVNPDDYACFQMDMLDPVTGDDLGSGTDCLIFNDIPNRVVKGRGLEKGRAFEGLAGDVAVDALSIFSFDNGDVLVTAGKTSVRPLLQGFGDGGIPQRTHITGSIPTPGENSVLLATGTREGRSGNARVSGALRADENGLFFDCLWVHES
jgi:hypothetical protein